MKTLIIAGLVAVLHLSQVAPPDQVIPKFQASFDTVEGDPAYDSSVDFNHDGVINLIDWSIYVTKYHAQQVTH